MGQPATGSRTLRDCPLVPAALLVAALAVVWLGADLLRASPVHREDAITGDLANYAAVLLQLQDPELFRGDLIFGDGNRTRLARAHARLYLVGLERAWQLAGQDLVRAVDLYRIALAIVYLPGMFLLLRRFSRHPSLSLGVAGLSVLPAGFFATGVRWGIPTTQVLPYHLLTALSPWLLLCWARIERVDRPRGTSSSAAAWLALGLGLGLCISFVHTLSGLALAQWILLLTALRAIEAGDVRRPLLLGVGLLAGFAPYVASAPSILPHGPAAGGSSVALSTSMVFPWLGHMVWRMAGPWLFVLPNRLLPLGWAEAVTGLVLTLHGAASLALYLRARGGSERARRGFVLVQLGMAVAIMSAGLIPFGVAAWILYRRRSPVDRRWWLLGTALAIALVLGPAQQALLLGVWRLWPAQGLASLVFESARLMQFAYLPLYLMVALALAEARRAGLGAGGCATMLVAVGLNIGRLPGQALLDPVTAMAVGAAAWAAWRQIPGRRALPHGDSEQSAALIVPAAAAVLPAVLVGLAGGPVWRVGLGVFLAATIAADTQHSGVPPPPRVLRLAAALVILVVLVLATGLVAIQVEDDAARGDAWTLAARAGPPSRRAALDPPYLDLLQWARTSTPRNAVFHLIPPRPSFRYLARRPILLNRIEWVYGLQAGTTVARLHSVARAVYPREPEVGLSEAVVAARKLGADYLVLGSGLRPPEPLPAVFSNSFATVYALRPIEN